MNRARVVPATLFCAALAVTGCGTTSSNDQAGEATTSSVTAPPTSQSIRAECLQVADHAGDLLVLAGQLAGGEATVDQVRTEATELSGALDDAVDTAGPDARADLDRAGQALRQVLDVLGVQPVDTAALRGAANNLVSALGAAAEICAPASSPAFPEPTDEEPAGTTTTTETVTTTVTTTS